MRFARVMVAALTAVGSAAAGCAHERLPWPPPPDQIARINETAREEKGYLRVEYVEPMASQAGVKVIKPIAIESIDEGDIAFRTRAGETQRVPSLFVRGLTVKDRARGGLVGGVLGAATGAGTLGALWVLAEWLNREGCLTCQPWEIAGYLAFTTAVGMAIGYVISGRRTFHFDRTP